MIWLEKIYDVVIVGQGPAGLAAGYIQEEEIYQLLF